MVIIASWRDSRSLLDPHSVCEAQKLFSWHRSGGGNGKARACYHPRLRYLYLHSGGGGVYSWRPSPFSSPRHAFWALWSWDFILKLKKKKEIKQLNFLATSHPPGVVLSRTKGNRLPASERRSANGTRGVRLVMSFGWRRAPDRGLT